MQVIVRFEVLVDDDQEFEAHSSFITDSSDYNDAVKSVAAEYAESDAQSEILLQMLGILPSESAFNPTARDAWTKRMPNHEPIHENVSIGLDGSTQCRNGHLRADYSYLNNQGKVVCRKCSAASTAAHRMRQREKKAA